MFVPNFTLENAYRLFGTYEPTLQWRGSGNLAVGTVVALALDYAASAYSNPTATPVITDASANNVWSNLTTMTTGNSQIGILAVALQSVTAGTGAYGKFCFFSQDVLVNVAQGNGITGAAGDLLTSHSNLTAAFAITAGQLFTQTKAALDGAIVPSLCWGICHEASGSSAATKRCMFNGTGWFSFGGGA